MLNINLRRAGLAHSYHIIRSAAETEKADAKVAWQRHTECATKLDRIKDRMAKVGFNDGSLDGARGDPCRPVRGATG